MEEQISKILSEVDFSRNSYFVNLWDGDFEKEDFLETQIQFFFAVIFFSRPMTALAGKIPLPQLRLEVLRNVWEEHGEGDLKKAHGETFREFLYRLGQVTLEDVEKRTLWPEVRLFNTCLIGSCVMDDYMVSVALMGMIERLFCEISSWIGQGVVKRAWISEERLIHYDLHAELDVKHAQDFFNVVRQSWEKNEENRYHIEQGLRLGVTLFHGLYEGLYANRKRRLSRSYLGPHSRAGGIL